MHRTRLSLFYLAGYLTFAGLALLLVPSFALKLLLSNGDYGDVFPRLAGMLLLGLAMVVFGIVLLGVIVTGYSYLTERRANA
jgi:hypothetical protein